VTDKPSLDEARAEFAAYVHSKVAPPPPAPQHEFEPGSAPAVMVGLLAHLFAFRIPLALAAFGAVFLIFMTATRVDHQRYEAIFAEHRYSMGTSYEYRWRYDGLDDNFFDRKKDIGIWERVRLHNTGLHVTSQEYLAHLRLRNVRTSTGLLLVLGLIVGVWYAWKRFQGDDDGYGAEVETSAPVNRVVASATGRSAFGRRAG
jgi:hypothetical protein